MTLEKEKVKKILSKASLNMVDINSIIEGTVKFRDGKKWKSRWCVMRKLSPVADCLHLQFYKDSKERFKNGTTKASLSLEHFLGNETGFTLDKESNTIAILCQDVIVILAFDTREILMQWQVKISSNLGDDVQYLVLVASAATKAKISSGPARLHIQNYRFCITTGIPPRLTGMWNIAHLRRYGVVDNRFCFEGGSSSGKCEGFVVLITDFGDEISNCFKLASQGKLDSNNRYIKPIDSPRRSKDAQSTKCDCSTSSIWPSQESRCLESLIGCDSSSLIDEIDSGEDYNHFSRKSLRTEDRCLSCSSKRTFVPTNISRSSTITEKNQEICFGFSSNNSPLSFEGYQKAAYHAMRKPLPHDRLSMRSQESCGNFSEYSIPKQSSILLNTQNEQARNIMGCYENYDSPKILSPSNDSYMENYDKPKNLKMYLEQNVAGKCKILNGEHNNYDKPNIHCCMSVQHHAKSNDCSWTNKYNWIPCRQGTGIESTTNSIMRSLSNVKTNQKVIAQEPAKCKLSNHSSQPNYLYAFVDPTRKQTKRLYNDDAFKISEKSHTPTANYANLDFEKSLENYENAREVLKREKALIDIIEVTKNTPEIKENENYLIMEIENKVKSNTFPEYIHMQPVGPTLKNKVHEREFLTIPIKKPKQCILRKGKKSLSNPDLNRPPKDIGMQKFNLKKSLSIDSESFTKNISSLNEFKLAALCSTYQNNVKTCSKASNRIHTEHLKVADLRYSENETVHANRDSSSSNDSGVSTSSNMHKHSNESELALKNVKKKHQVNQIKPCVHASLIRRSKSFDPFADLSFRFANKKNSSNFKLQNKSSKFPSLGAIVTGQIDSNSTSSGTSDMSDYIETLSLSSYSSSDVDALKKKQNTSNTLRPRSGKEYEKIDRIFGLMQASNTSKSSSPISSTNYNYVNVLSVPKNSGSPSPGYQSSTSFQDEFSGIKEPQFIVHQQ